MLSNLHTIFLLICLFIAFIVFYQRHKEIKRIKKYKNLYIKYKEKYSNQYRLVYHEYSESYCIQQLQGGNGWRNYSNYISSINCSCPEEFFVETILRIEHKEKLMINIQKFR